jgi:hypothetical protein
LGCLMAHYARRRGSHPACLKVGGWESGVGGLGLGLGVGGSEESTKGGCGYRKGCVLCEKHVLADMECACVWVDIVYARAHGIARGVDAGWARMKRGRAFGYRGFCVRIARPCVGKSVRLQHALEPFTGSMASPAATRQKSSSLALFPCTQAASPLGFWVLTLQAEALMAALFSWSSSSCSSASSPMKYSYMQTNFNAHTSPSRLGQLIVPGMRSRPPLSPSLLSFLFLPRGSSEQLVNDQYPAIKTKCIQSSAQALESLGLIYLEFEGGVGASNLHHNVDPACRTGRHG